MTTAFPTIETPMNQIAHIMREPAMDTNDLYRMRQWVADQASQGVYADANRAFIMAHCTDEQIRRVIERDYPGGVRRFLLDKPTGKNRVES